MPCLQPAVTDDTFVLETRHKGSQWLVEHPESDLLTIMVYSFPMPVFPNACFFYACPPHAQPNLGICASADLKLILTYAFPDTYLS